jgi:putative transcriptional regulator
VRELRSRLGLTQEKLGALLGVSFATVNRWENRRTSPSPLARDRLREEASGLGDAGGDLLRRF